MSPASSSSCVLFAILALSLFAAAATTASSHPSPHAAATTERATATATTSSGPSPHAATATTSLCPPPHAATATATATASPQGHPPAEETMEEAPSTLEEEEHEEERYLVHDLQQLMRDSATAKTTAARLEHLGNVLQLLGFREMAAAVPALAASPILASWPGPLTVFAVPDEVLQCRPPDCWMEAIIVAHIALGSFPYAELSSKPQMKVPAVLMGFCFTSSSASSSTSNVAVSIDGVNVVRPDLYNDDRLVVHGMERDVTLPPQGSCFSSRLLSRVDILRLMVRLVASANRQ